jgi:anti-sigma B factor antagonist
MSRQPFQPFSPDPERFDCEVDAEREGVRIAPSGALDMATVPILEARLRDVRNSGFRRLIVDLRRLDFIDSSGLRLLLRNHAEASQDGFSFALIAGPPSVQRLFELSNTLDMLTFVDP